MTQSTTIVLVRSGETLWGEQGRLLGRRDIGLTEKGTQQAQRALSLLGEITVTEILASPQARAIETADFFAQHFQLGIGRDPRLMDLHVGKWEGQSWHTMLDHPDFVDFFAGKAAHFPDGEDLQTACRRAVASVEDTAVDNPPGAYIVMVTHSSIIRLILTHYLKMPAGAFILLQVNCGSLTVLRFTSEMTQPILIGLNSAIPVAEMFAEVPD